MNKNLLIFLTFFLFTCFKHSLIDRLDEDYFPLHKGFKSQFLYLPYNNIVYFEVVGDTTLLGEDCHMVSFFGIRKFFYKNSDYIREYFERVFYTGEDKYIMEKTFLPFIPIVFINGERISDSVSKKLIIEGDTVLYIRKLDVRIRGPKSFKIEEREFDDVFEVFRNLEVKIKVEDRKLTEIKTSYEIYAPSHGLIFYVSGADTFKYIGGR